MKTKLHGGVDGGAGEDDGDEKDEEDGDHDVGDDLERLAGHGAILMDVGVHRFVAVVHGAQLVLDHVGLLNMLLLARRGCGLLHFLDGTFFLLHGSGFGLLGLGFGFLGIERGLQVGSTVGTETDAAGQLLAAMVAELGFLGADRAGIGGVAIGGIGVVTDNEFTAFVLAHCKALRTHDLTIVYHQFFLRDGHPFPALWALEFHKSAFTRCGDKGTALL